MSWKDISSVDKEGYVSDLFVKRGSVGWRIPDCYFKDGKWWRCMPGEHDDLPLASDLILTHWMKSPPSPSNLDSTLKENSYA